jgi:hypothetical protein
MRYIIILILAPSCKYQLFLSYFYETRYFLYRFFKNIPILNFMKIHPVRAQLFRTDTQTDMTKLTVAFSTFVNVPSSTSLDFGFSKWCN